jgi:transcriptional regulator with XRE-family HTH domain
MTTNQYDYGALSKLELGKINNINISTLNSLINYLEIDLTLLLLDDKIGTYEVPEGHFS